MIIVRGVFVVPPADRDRIIENSTEEIIAARRAPGCLEYVLLADPIDSRRAVLSARWASMDDLTAHHANSRRSGDAPDATAWQLVESQDLTVYDDEAGSRQADWSQLDR